MIGVNRKTGYWMNNIRVVKLLPGSLNSICQKWRASLYKGNISIQRKQSVRHNVKSCCLILTHLPSFLCHSLINNYSICGYKGLYIFAKEENDRIFHKIMTACLLPFYFLSLIVGYSCEYSVFYLVSSGFCKCNAILILSCTKRTHVKQSKKVSAEK